MHVESQLSITLVRCNRVGAPFVSQVIDGRRPTAGKEAALLFPQDQDMLLSPDFLASGIPEHPLPPHHRTVHPEL